MSTNAARVYFWNMDRLLTFLERSAEKRLTRKKRLKAYNSSRKHTVLGEIWSWVDALIFAIFWVILINQYLFQLFVIPSPSMVDTLNVGDRVIVNKDSYGVELYPAGRKVLTDSRRVQRDEIITFYNPEYDSKGPFFDVLSQVIYMGTLTLVNIDRNDDGTPAERLYVKRAVGMPGDTIRFEDGNVLIKPSGDDSFIREEEFRAANALAVGPHRSVEAEYYPALEAAATLTAYQEKGLGRSAPMSLYQEYSKLDGSAFNYIFDRYEYEKARTAALSSFDPSDMSLRSEHAKYENGIYVPEDHVLPLGDNRDNSRDGRYFGAVPESDINGRVIGRFWPINRISSLADNR